MRSEAGALIATIVAGLFAGPGCQSTSAPSTPSTPSAPADAPNTRGDSKATSTKVRCSGINDCSGKGACASATNSCAGKNQCKGKGWIEIDGGEIACTNKGGTIVKADPMKGG